MVYPLATPKLSHFPILEKGPDWTVSDWTAIDVVDGLLHRHESASESRRCKVTTIRRNQLCSRLRTRREGIPIAFVGDFGEVSLGGKWLERLSEIAPGLNRAAIMFNPDTSTASIFMYFA